MRDLIDRPALAGGAAAGTTDIAVPHEVYTLGLNDLAKKDLHRAHKVGWRYLVVRDNQPVAAAEVSGSDERRLQFSHLNTGPFVEETARALALAEGLGPVAKNKFEVRLLTVPALYVVALWLHGKKQDILIPMQPTNEHLIPSQPYAPAEFFKELLPAAEARLAFDDAPQK